MIKILVNDGIHPEGKLLLEEAGYQVDTDKIAQENLPKELPAYDAIIVRSATKVRKELIEVCPNLKVIARGGVGLDNVDVEFAKSKGIEVMNTPAASSQSVAELVFAHFFTLSRFLQQSNRAMPAKGDSEFKKLKKSYSHGIQLRGKTLGIIGFGRIGQEVARIAIGLGINVIPVDPIIQEAILPIHIPNGNHIHLQVTVKTKDWDELLKKSDFITLHVPGGSGTLVGKEQFDKMKEGVLLVNAARGGTVDEEALLEALNSGRVAGAALDVFVNEPTPKRKLLQHPSISLTPHIGASTNEAQRNIGLELADKIISFFGA